MCVNYRLFPNLNARTISVTQPWSLPDGIPAIDEYASMSHAARGDAPMILISGGRNLEMLARYEGNAHLQFLLAHFKHDSVSSGTGLRSPRRTSSEGIRRNLH